MDWYTTNLDRPNYFCRVQIVLASPNNFLDYFLVIWTSPKQIGPVQKDWYTTKMICKVQNYFGPIEGQDSSVVIIASLNWAGTISCCFVF